MTTEQMAQTLYELQQQNIQTAEYISVLAAERDSLRERAERAESQVAELRGALQVAVQTENQIWERVRRAEGWIGNLLARIHRDGGQHIEAVGWEQAIEDADRILAELIVVPGKETPPSG